MHGRRTGRAARAGGPAQRRARWVCVALALGAAASAAAAGGGAASDDGIPEAQLTGEQIYARVIGNRFRSFSQESRLVSADRGGRAQETRLRMHWKDFRDGDGRPRDGVLSKAVVRYTHPSDIRFAGYLVQDNAERANDQFVYYPSRRRVVRVSLRNEALHGTDFSFEDVIPRELADATYRRLPDAEFGGVPVFVVELVPVAKADSAYSKVWVYVEKRRFVPLRTRYWDSAGVEIKELAADPATLREFDGVWIPMRATMRHLLFETWTRLEITELEPNPALGEHVFDLGRLESH
jgi:hypothetical protein